MPNSTFLDRVCQQHKLSELAAEERLFWRSIPPWRRPLVWLLRRVDPGTFAHDMNVVHEAGKATKFTDLSDIPDLLHRRAPIQSRFVRVTFGFRISSNRLLELAKDYFRREADQQKSR